MAKSLRRWKLVNSVTGQVVPNGSTVLLPSGKSGKVVTFKPPQGSRPGGVVYVQPEGEETWPEEIHARYLMLLVVPG